ncbi:MAG: hypothetical protein IJV06_10830 [Bacteroidaceae bacterium]|nr:hypothetical protein [Bacteroidaceae bacterium]
MNRRFFEIAMLCLSALMLNACLKKDEDSGESHCAITAFSVGSITSYVTTTDGSGNSVTTKRTVAGSDIFFSIDQKAGTITNVDELPNWISLTKVLPTFSSFGDVFLVDGDYIYGITSGTDSLDVSVPRKLACFSTDGLYRKDYTLTMRKRAEVSDTILWERLSAADLKLTTGHRALTMSVSYKDADGTDSLVRRMFVFSEDEDGSPAVSSSLDGVSWLPMEALASGSDRLDYQSVTVHQGKLYALNEQGWLFSSTELSKGLVWTEVGDAGLQRLLGSDGLYLYGYDGTKIVATRDLENWTSAGEQDVAALPEHSIYCFASTSKTNGDLTMVMMGGITSVDEQHGVTWYKTSSLNSEYNEPWSYIQVTGDNAYGCPRLLEQSTVCYNGCLYAMGRRLQSDGSYKFEGFYRSEDNGIAWHLQKTKWLLPKDLNAADGPASIMVIGNRVYVVQMGGRVWRGEIL